MNWFRDSKPSRPVGWGTDDPPVPDRQAEPQADGDARDRTQTSPPEDSNESKPTRYEPYPQMSFVEKEELLILLKAKVALLEKSVEGILALLEQSK